MGLWIFYESSNVTLHLLKIDAFIKVVEGQMVSSSKSSLTKFDFAAQCFS